MAIYHLSAKPVSRSSGRSATSAAAYRAGVEITDQRTGVVHDYTRRGGVLYSELMLPGGGTADRGEFWNRLELHHKRGDAVLVREIEIALPAELPADQRRELATSYARELADRYQVAADIALHAPRTVTDRELEQAPDMHHETDPETGRRHNGNWHAHIMLSACHVAPDGTLGRKAVALDPIHCQRAKVENAADRERPRWAELVNEALERAGRPERVDHRSLADQRAAALAAGDLERAAELDRLPTIHEGPRVTQIRRECEQEQRGPLGACDVIELNDARRLPPLATLRAEAQQLEAEIIDLAQHRQERALRRDVGELERRLAAPEPRCMAVAKAQKREMEQARQVAQQWHQEHPIRSTLSSWFGVTPRVDQEAEAARQAFNDSEARRQAQQWQQERAQAQQRHQEARQQLLATPGVAEAARRLEDASRALRRAEGLSENHITWAVLDERAALAQERRAHQELRREIEAARERIPTPTEARELEQRAGQHLERMEQWEQIEQQRRAEAQQELERRAAERLRDRPAPGEDGPRRSGPKFSGPR